MSDGGHIHILAGPSHTVATADDDRPTRWCFDCRKHLPHAWALMDYPPEFHPSYYEPVAVIRCSRCGRDRITHPGSYRDGPAPLPRSVAKALSERARVEYASWDWDAIWTRFHEEEVA